MKNNWNENNTLFRKTESSDRDYSFILTFDSEYDRFKAFKKLQKMGYETVLLEQALRFAEFVPRYLERLADSREGLYVEYRSDKDTAEAIMEFLDKVEKSLPQILNIWDDENF